MVPYTYLIRHNPSGRLYYGLRFSKKCHPKDLWKTYFTSSKEIHRLINEDGLESFSCEIRKTFDTVEKAILWEGKVLRRIRAAQRSIFINRINTVAMDVMLSPEIRERASQHMKDRYKTGWNPCNDPKVREKISKALKGKFVPWNKGKKNVYSNDAIQKMRVANLRSPLRNTKWFHHPNLTEHGRFELNQQPNGWLPGMKPTK